MAKKSSAGKAPTTITEAWSRIETWMRQHEPKWKPLKKPATARQIATAEIELGIELPWQLREWYLCHNGSDDGGFFVTPEGGSFFLLNLTDVVGIWKVWQQVCAAGDFDDSQAKPDKYVRKQWWNAGWIPFASNGGGDEWCIDTAPGRGGKVGQVIVVVSDDPRRQFIGDSLLAWMAAFTAELEAGKLSYDADEGGLHSF